MSGREKPLILQTGMPIPQAYDEDLGDWTEYSTEHIKAIKAELALVKAELQTIKANQLSGDQKVQLSGDIVVDTLYDAITLTSNTAAPAVDVPNRNANAILLAIISDKNRVRIYKNALPGDSAVVPVGDIDLTNTDVSGPVFVEPLLGYHFRIFQPGGTVGLVEAPVDISLQHTKDLRIIIQNLSGETATFTVKALHFWR